MNVYESDLIHLKNIGAASVNILYAIGIRNTQELRDIGAVGAYRRIQDRGISVSKVMLYAMQGALDNIHWNDLSVHRKAELLEAVRSDCMNPAPSAPQHLNSAAS
jgi:DNA transformation protein